MTHSESCVERTNPGCGLTVSKSEENQPMAHPLLDARAPFAFSARQRRILLVIIAAGLLVAQGLILYGKDSPVGATTVKETVFGSAQPTIGDSGDHQAVEVGTRLQISQRGWILAVRFWKSPANTGAHVGSFWSNKGRLIGRVTFTNETASGWQEADFASPIWVVPGTYVVSYHTNVGDYSDDTGYFAGHAVGPQGLTAVADGQGGPNSVYAYGASAFPTHSWKSSNYWVDVVFLTRVGSGSSGDPTTTSDPTTSTTDPPTTSTTDPPTTSTTAPPTTSTTTPTSGSWPCALNAAAETCYVANTGASGTLTHVSGDVRLTSSAMTNLSNGTTIATPSGTDSAGRSVYTGYDIAGCVQIATGRVALNNSYIHSGDRCTKPPGDTTGTGPALVTAGGEPSLLSGGVALTSDSLDGLNVDTSTQVARPCLLMTDMVATRVDVQGCTHDVWPIMDSTLSYSYVHDPTYTYFASSGLYLHRNDIMVDGVEDITIDHVFAKQTWCPNAVPGDPGNDWCNAATSAISLLSDYGGDHDVMITNNYVMGGSNYDMYGGAPLGTNITLSNNHLAPWGYTGAGTGQQVPTAHGTGVPYATCDGVIDTCSGNVNAETGAAVSL
jgi:hypothetical protein